MYSHIYMYISHLLSLVQSEVYICICMYIHICIDICIYIYHTCFPLCNLSKSMKYSAIQ